ncbi:hypothetical protein DY000_02014457 [Brassica cretica]|uniref:Uncharacterized protein n=2 Tax=Brassica TaxID=3705 RepID=A0ABQ7D6X4_BRACR|nr:hypothetical protein DY000_02014457 [Brassica cretica]
MKNRPNIDLARGFVTPLQWVAPAPQRVRHLAPGRRYGFLRTSWIWRAMNPPRSVLVALVLESCRRDVGPRAGTLRRSRSQRLLDPAALVRSRSCSYRDEMPSRLMMSLREVTPGDLEYLSLGINEVLFAYHLVPLNGGEGRFHLHPRSGLPIVEELPKSDRKVPVFNKKWQERYAFLVFPGSSHRWNFIVGTHPAPSEGEKAVLWARQLPADRRQVNFLVSETVLRRSSFWTYQEAAKVMSAKKGSSIGSASRDERPKSGGVTTRSAQQSVDIARSTGSLATVLSNLNLNVFPQDGTVLPIGDSSEVIQVLQGGLLRHLGERLSDEGLLVLREEVEVLKRQVSGEKEQRVAREFEIRDLKEKVKDLEKVAEASSADALAMNQKNQEMEEDIEALKAAAETFKFEMVMAVNGARVVARRELMREWLRKQSAQWDLVTALEQYKAVVQEEARSKGAPLPTLEDEPAIPPSSDMDVDSSVKPRGSPT